jgi:hypothetical protein
VCNKGKKFVKRKAYHQTLKQQNPPHHILIVKTALKVAQKVPKHAQQVEEGFEGQSTSKGSKTCSTSCKVWTKVLCKENLSRKLIPLPAPQVLPLSLNRDLKV